MRIILCIAALLLSSVSPAFARTTQDQARFGQDITVAEGETAGDIACAFCSVHLHGSAKGDVAVFLGSVTVDDGQNVGGDVAIFGGDLKLGMDSHVGGDVAIVAGNADAAAGAIRGDRVVLAGPFWLLVPLAPFLILAGIIWLVVWLVRRNRYHFPAYPGGQGLPPMGR